MKIIFFKEQNMKNFLLENNQTAVGFEKRLKNRESQKNLFDYVGAGIVLPNLLIKQIYKEENSKINLEFINLDKFYKKDFTNEELQTFINENKDDLKVEYIDFDYAIINPKNLIGIDEIQPGLF